MQESKLAHIGKALSDPKRLEILRMLTRGEEIGCHLLAAFEITQPTFSHHMKMLCDCGLVNDRRDGKCHYYSINSDTIRAYQAFLTTLAEPEMKET